MSVFNFSNDNNRTGNYPLFLGESLGFSDEINVTYPEIDKMHKKQRSAFWIETQYSYEQDRIDLMDAPDSEKDVMVLNLLAQWALDSMASRSLIEVLGPLISNTELHNWILTQSFFESIHAATYAKIVRNCFADSNAVLERGKQNLEVFERCRRVGEVMNATKKLAGRYMAGEIEVNEYTKYGLMKQIYIAMAAVYALEQISFKASFAPTFALVESGKYADIKKSVSEIMADESYHAQGDKIVIEIMQRNHPTIVEDTKDEVKTLVEQVLLQEFRWAEYIFSDGRKILGNNTELLMEYSRWEAIPAFKTLQVDWDVSLLGEQPKENPLPYMVPYGDRDSVQTANQEEENNNYRVAQVDDDLGNAVFDF